MEKLLDCNYRDENAILQLTGVTSVAAKLCRISLTYCFLIFIYHFKWWIKAHKNYEQVQDFVWYLLFK